MGLTMQDLTQRDRAILRAVGAGRAEVVWGAAPGLYVDGRCCCDQLAAARLARAGLIAPATATTPGHRSPACLTASGRAGLAA